MAVEDVGDLEYIKELFNHFGGRRTAQLLGFAIPISLTGKKLSSEIVPALMNLGFSRSAAYRAVNDFVDFNEYLNEKYSQEVSLSERAGLLSAAYQRSVRAEFV